MMSPILALKSACSDINEMSCHLFLEDRFTNVWVIIVAYGIPIFLSVAIYFRIIFFVRQRSNIRLMIITRQQYRDCIAIRCIFVSIILLFSSAVLTVVFSGLYVIAFSKSILLYHVARCCFSFFIFLLSLAMTRATPELRRMFLWYINRRRIVPVISLSMQKNLDTQWINRTHLDLFNKTKDPNEFPPVRT